MRNSMKRRLFLKILGGGVVLAATGSTTFALTRTPKKALTPWESVPSPSTDPRLIASSFAILAPNPHNRQPWLIKLEGNDTLILHCELGRKLPHTDPYDRQILIGLGCFLELLEISAKEIGWRLQISLFPKGLPGKQLDTRPIAKVIFSQGKTVEKDPLFNFIVKRRSNKEPFFTDKKIDTHLLEKIKTAVKHGVSTFATNDLSTVKTLRDLAWKAHLVETYTPRTLKESVDLMRIGKKEIEANPDGIDLGGPFFEIMKLVGLMDKKKMLDTTSESFKGGLDHYQSLHYSAMSYIWMVTDGNSRHEQITTGRDYVRLNLAATANGLGFHPISQGMQEYNEMDEVREQFNRQLNVQKSSKLQMLVRLGYGAKISPSPRWPLKTRIV